MSHIQAMNAWPVSDAAKTSYDSTLATLKGLNTHHQIVQFLEQVEHECKSRPEYVAHEEHDQTTLDAITASVVTRLSLATE